MQMVLQEHQIFNAAASVLQKNLYQRTLQLVHHQSAILVTSVPVWLIPFTPSAVVAGTWTVPFAFPLLKFRKREKFSLTGARQGDILLY